MSDVKPKMKSAFIISSFEDAGTGAAYTAGATVEIEEGHFTNYEAARLVRTPTTDDKKAGAADKGAAA